MYSATPGLYEKMRGKRRPRSRIIVVPPSVTWILIALLMLVLAVLVKGQSSKTPIKNGILQSDLNAAGYKILSANLVDYAGANMTWNAGTGKFDATGGGGGGSGTVTSITATTPIIVTPSPLVATGVISLTVGSSGGVEAWDADLDTWATKTPYAGAVTVTTAKTFNCTGNLTLSGTDGSTLNVGGGGTLGTAAYTASSAYQVSGSVDDTIYGAGWNGVTTIAPSKNAVYDQMELQYLRTGGTLTGAATISMASPALTLNPVSGTSVIDIRGTASTNDGIRLSATGTTGSYLADTQVFKNRANAVTYGTFSSTGLDLGTLTLKADKVNAVTGFQVNTAAASGVILQGNGTNYVASTPTWPTAAGAAGYTIRSDATNLASYPAQLVNSSVANQTPSTSDVYLTGSNIVVTAGDMKAKGQYKCVFDMTKSAGTGAIVITLRVGTAGTTSDAAIQTYTFGAGTSVADIGIFEVIATWRTVGSGTSAVIQGICRGTHQLATTGLFNNAAGWVLIGSPSPSSGFNSSTATNIGISFNGATAFAGTTTLVQAQLQQ